MRRQMRWVSLLSLGAAAAVGAVGCLGEENDSGTTTQTEGAVLGDALPGTNAATFADAKANFAAVENATDGLGPIFNDNACGTCHQNGALGGAGQQIEARYGTLTNGVFDGLVHRWFAPSAVRHWWLQHRRSELPIRNRRQSGAGCDDLRRSRTTPLFGLGLVDSLPDARFDTLASREPAAIRGVLNRSRSCCPIRRPVAAARACRALRLESQREQSGPVLGRCVPERDGHHHHQFGARIGDAAFATENRANRAPTNAIINGCPDDAVPGTDDDFATETTTARADATRSRTTWGTSRSS